MLMRRLYVFNFYLYTLGWLTFIRFIYECGDSKNGIITNHNVIITLSRLYTLLLRYQGCIYMLNFHCIYISTSLKWNRSTQTPTLFKLLYIKGQIMQTGPNHLRNLMTVNGVDI